MDWTSFLAGVLAGGIVGGVMAFSLGAVMGTLIGQKEAWGTVEKLDDDDGDTMEALDLMLDESKRSN